MCWNAFCLVQTQWSWSMFIIPPNISSVGILFYPCASVRPSVRAHNSGTVGAIHLKLGGCVPWPKGPRRFFHFSILSLYVVTRGRYWKTHYCHFQANGDSYDHQIFLWVRLIRLHHISYWFLIWPTFQGHKGQSSKFHLWWAHFNAIGHRGL